MAKRRKANKGKGNSFINQIEDDGLCFHNWHLVRYIENPFTNIMYAVFICDKCHKIKRVEGKEEKEGD